MGNTRSVGRVLWNWLPGLIIALGLLLRLNQYFVNRSLWLDEAFIAVHVANSSFLELLNPSLEYSGYIAPPGFLLLAKLAITLFGNSDLFLRIVPFLCGWFALLFYYPLAKNYVSEKAVPLALFLFAVSGSLVFYSSEFKQYSCDVLVAVFLYWFIAVYRSQLLTIQGVSALAAAGSVAVWVSHPSVIILFTIGVYLVLPYLRKGQLSPVIKLGSVYFIWLVNFAALQYFFIQEETLNDKALYEFWAMQNAFMPSPFSLEGIHWIYDSFFSVLEYPGKLGNVYIAAVMALFGGISLFSRKKGALFLLTFPVLLTLLLSFFQLYPFSGRLLLFLLPALYLMVAEGIVQIKVILLAYPRSSIISRATQLVLLASLIVFPVHHPHFVQEIRPALWYMRQHMKRQDMVYLYYWAEPAFRYYSGSLGYDFKDCQIITQIPGNDTINPVDYSRLKRKAKPAPVSETRCVLGVSQSFAQSLPDMEQLRGQGRVWFVFTHIGDKGKKRFLEYLDGIGVRVTESIHPGASTYLYEL